MGFKQLLSYKTPGRNKILSALKFIRTNNVEALQGYLIKFEATLNVNTFQACPIKFQGRKLDHMVAVYNNNRQDIPESVQLPLFDAFYCINVDILLIQADLNSSINLKWNLSSKQNKNCCKSTSALYNISNDNINKRNDTGIVVVLTTS